MRKFSFNGLKTAVGNFLQADTASPGQFDMITSIMLKHVEGRADMPADRLGFESALVGRLREPSSKCAIYAFARPRERKEEY